MQLARETRQARAQAAARTVIRLAREEFTELMSGGADDLRPSLMWEVRGEVRNRRHFADPHPDDFRGGLPMPADCPRMP